MPEHVRFFKPMTPHSTDMATDMVDFLAPFLQLPCTYFWRGFGSAMFLEFGTLSDKGFRHDGSPRNPSGEWGLCLDFNWRVEGKRLIWCGSADEEEDCSPSFKRLVGKKITKVGFPGHFPEMHLEFENGLHVVTFTIEAGNPSWSLMKNLAHGYQALCSRGGQVILETCVVVGNA